MIAFNSHKGWIQHAGGLEALMDARGPWLHKKNPDRSILMDNKVLIVSMEPVR